MDGGRRLLARVDLGQRGLRSRHLTLLTSQRGANTQWLGSLLGSDQLREPLLELRDALLRSLPIARTEQLLGIEYLTDALRRVPVPLLVERLITAVGEPDSRHRA